MSKGKLLTSIEAILPPILGVSLLATLFPTPRPAMGPLHPWKVELLTSFVLLALIALTFCKFKIIDLHTLTRNSFLKAVFVFLTIFVMWSAASAGWSTSAYSALHHTFVWSTLVLAFVLAVLYFQSTRSISAVNATFVWVTVILGALCLTDYITLPDFRILEGTLRIRYAKYAELLVTILPVLWVAAVYKRSKMGYLLMTGAGVVGWLVVMLSLSKGAFIAGLIGFFVTTLGCLAFSHRTFRRRILISSGAWIALTIAIQGGFSFFSPVPATTDYITGAADSTRETSMMRVFTWKVGRQMFEDNWLIGVGADNFGASFNTARQSFRENHPGDTTAEFGEDYLVERAHNEPIQVAGELGIVGLILLVLPFALIAIRTFQTFLANGFKLSPMLWASIGGSISFAISSSVSSFSFRAVQNGIAFFLVLAIAVHELRKQKFASPAPSHSVPHSLSMRWAVAAVLVILITQTAFFSRSGVSEYLAIAAAGNSDHQDAIRMYDLAFRIDPNYPGVMISSAFRSELSGDSIAAARKMRVALDGGMGVPTTYSTLAKYQLNAGLPGDAEQTLYEAVKIFPRSVFLRTRLAVLLQDSGKFSDADVQLNAAADVESRQAAGWYTLMRKGGLIAFYEAQKNSSMAPPADLVPISIVREFLGEETEVSKR